MQGHDTRPRPVAQPEGAANLRRPMSDVADHPKPSPEIEQLVLFGRLDEAVALYGKQAEVDEATARSVIDALAAA